MHNLPTIADRVRTLRQGAGLTQAQFASALHFSRDYISQIENGRQPSERFIQQISLLEKVGMTQFTNDDYVGIEPLSAGLGKNSSPADLQDTLRSEIRRSIEDSIQAAEDDIGKLGWLREQVLRYTARPEHWTLEDMHARALRQALAERAGIPIADQPDAAHGKAS